MLPSMTASAAERGAQVINHAGMGTEEKKMLGYRVRNILVDIEWLEGLVV